MTIGQWLVFGPPPRRPTTICAPAGLADGPGAPAAQETTVPLEHGLGVWITRVVLDGTRLGRYQITVDGDQRRLSLRPLARD